MTLKPIEWIANIGAKEPRVQLDQLRVQTVRRDNGATYRRTLWHKQREPERQRDLANGVSIVREKRILPGIGREFLPPLDEGSFLYMPSLLPQAGLGPAARSERKTGHGHGQCARSGKRGRQARARRSPLSIQRRSE